MAHFGFLLLEVAFSLHACRFPRFFSASRWRGSTSGEGVRWGLRCIPNLSYFGRFNSWTPGTVDSDILHNLEQELLSYKCRV
jgi:hypothetical protein